MSHPALDKAWEWLERETVQFRPSGEDGDRIERVHKTLSELEVELYRIDQAQYVAPAAVAASGVGEPAAASEEGT